MKTSRPTKIFQSASFLLVVLLIAGLLSISPFPNSTFIPEAHAQPAVKEIITSGTTWTVPEGVTSITAEAIGAGQDGSTSAGGAGGAYAKTASISVAAGQVLDIQIGVNGTGLASGDTWLENNGGTKVMLAKGGGSPTSSIGDTTYAGGAGGGSPTTAAGSGGGGSAGPLGAGKSGGTACQASCLPGGGGGGANGGSSTAGNSSSGAGGQGPDGTGGGVPPGGNATNFKGAGGAGGTTGGAAGGAGSIDTSFDATHGAGGGGGGASGATTAGNGGTYGGGGGGLRTSGGGTVGSGGDGILVISYVPEGYVQDIVTSGTTWTVPNGVTSVTAEAIGAGQNGTPCKGGDGGSYSITEGITVAAGQVLDIQVGVNGSGQASGDTWLENNGGTKVMLAKGGGSPTSSIGNTIYAGGTGGSGGECLGPFYGGGGGGGSAGPLGIGKNGGSGAVTGGGGGGGGSNGSASTSGAAPTGSGPGGLGGHGTGGTGGNQGSGGSGTSGTGAAGSGANDLGSQSGGNGAIDTSFDATHGAGGGGGGNSQQGAYNVGPYGNGGAYGGGGGGKGNVVPEEGGGGDGGDGILILSYIVGIPFYDTGGTWLYRKAITIDHTKVANTNQTDFPVLINLGSDSDLAADARSDGHDILFTDSSGNTKIPYEREKWNETTGELVAWVKIPTLSASTDTVIYMYYGNASSSSDQQQASSVWESNYKFVQHFEETSACAVSFTDSTSPAENASCAVGSTGLNSTTGLMGNARVLSSNADYIAYDTGASLLATGSVTVSAWVNFTNTIPSNNTSIYNIYQLADTNSCNDIALEIDSTRPIFALYGTGSCTTSVFSRSTTTRQWTAGTWYYVVGTWNATDGIKIYYNGAIDATPTSMAARGTTPNAVTQQIGKFWQDTATFPGKFDEVRGSSTARSADWILTEYNNQSSPSTFYALDAEDSQTAPTESCTLSASPLVIKQGASSSLTWTTTNAINASIDNGVGAVSPVASGSTSVSPTVTTTYTMTATNAGTATCNATVTLSTTPRLIHLKGGLRLKGGVRLR